MLARAAELAVAMLVSAEIVLLLAGVVARYLFRRPLVWSDELASILFLWLACLGAVVAFVRSQHMRMTFLNERSSPRAKVILELTAAAASLAFLCLVITPSVEYALAEASILTPALEISAAWRAAALPAGLGLMMAIALLRMWQVGRARDVALACAIVAAVVAAAWIGKPLLVGHVNTGLALFFVVGLGGLIVAGIPIAFAFGLATAGYIATMTHSPLIIVIGRMDEGMSHLINLAIPLFVFLGLLIEMTGMARAMINFLASLLGHLRGGLSYVLLGGMYLVSGISGSKVADMAAVGPVLFPEMKRRGADEGELVALLSTSGAMAETIPPSLVLIVVGSVCGVSIAALFTGGLLPAAVAALALGVLVWFRSGNDKQAQTPRASGALIGKTFLIAVPALILPFVIRAAVVEGVATATEVSTIGIAYSVVAGLLVYRQFDWRRLVPMLVETASLSGAILLIIGVATAMAWALTQSGFSQSLATAMAALPGGTAGFLAVSVILFIVLGAMLEGLPAILVFGPLLFPIARQLGVHDVHYSMVMIMAMGVGLFAPPFGIGFYAACAIGKADPQRCTRAILPYLLALIVALVAVTAIPWISIGFL